MAGDSAITGQRPLIITTDGELIRALTLDPTRSYQPLGGRWPVHDGLCTMACARWPVHDVLQQVVHDVVRYDRSGGGGISRLGYPLLD
jgi:hypothetical protein